MEGKAMKGSKIGENINWRKIHGRRLIRDISIFLVVWGFALALIGGLWPVFVSLIATGYFGGSMVGYREGMADHERIIKNVYGEDWDAMSVYGRIHRQQQERKKPQWTQK